ncbi:hypothetical protein CEXT_456941 [Caerostris extrusa]|uniref:Uncharacterized protein n=1 Tax=Caerostris extrusa TaxID=172846 RepID=A0AAV4MI60_CAEEX|nr:hypothetical protein CEXT_456941 [Caerostris extrusa]
MFQDNIPPMWGVKQNSLSLSLSLLFALLYSLSKDKEERNCLNNSDIQKNKKRTFRLSINLRVVDQTAHKRRLFFSLEKSTHRCSFNSEAEEQGETGTRTKAPPSS